MVKEAKAVEALAVGRHNPAALRAANGKLAVPGQVHAKIIDASARNVISGGGLENLFDDDARALVFHQRSAGAARHLCLHPFPLGQRRIIHLAAAQLALHKPALPRLPGAVGAEDGLSIRHQAGDHLQRALPRRRLKLPRIADGGGIPAAAQLHRDLVPARLQQGQHVVLLKIDAPVIGGKRRCQQTSGHRSIIDPRIEEAHSADLQQCGLRKRIQFEFPPEFGGRFHLAHRNDLLRTDDPFRVSVHMAFLPSSVSSAR